MEEGDEREIPFFSGILSKLSSRLGFEIVLVKKHTEYWATVRRRYKKRK
jgi:hypothetical protein